MIFKQKIGFTLVEVLVVLGIIVLIGVIVGNFGWNIFWQNETIVRELSAEGEAKLALTKIITELRQAQPANNGAYALEMASASAVVFYSDVDHDGARERLNYFLSGKELKRGIIEPTVGEPYTYDPGQEQISVVVNDLINDNQLIFSYYDQDYSGAETSPALTVPIDVKKVRSVKINFLIDANVGRSPVPLAVSGLAMLRNLK